MLQPNDIETFEEVGGEVNLEIVIAFIAFADVILLFVLWLSSQSII